MENLDLKFGWNSMAHTHFAYPNLALGKFSGPNPEQAAETIIQLFEWKINFTVGNANGDAGELANYTFRKDALFFVFTSSTRALMVRQQHYQCNYLRKCPKKFNH